VVTNSESDVNSQERIKIEEFGEFGKLHESQNVSNLLGLENVALQCLYIVPYILYTLSEEI
jgi:hypothetical protein